MCGIVGVLDPSRSISADRLAALAATMALSLEHRGPDDHGTWVDAEAGIALGHRRLSVVGLGPSGAQPMVSSTGRWVLSYNGEVYNHQQLRRRLAKVGTRFSGDSDTEVLVAAVEHWGVESALDACEGMFACALWDRRDRQLHLVRDRFGEKPLYYGWVGRQFVFGSELKSLHAVPGFRGELDRAAVVDYLHHNCISAPKTVFRDVYKLLPGHMATVQGAAEPGLVPAQHCYWSANEAVSNALAHPMALPDAQLVDHLEATLSQAVADRMVADVPVGAFLSGGIDSSTVVALMQRHSKLPVRTFTVGFEHRAFDESAEAAAVANHLGTDHTTVIMGDQEAMEAITHIPQIWDEPFSDVSQIPTLLVSKVARQQVTVALSGDGGDELFAGYNRHAWVDRLWGTAGAWPPGVRRRIGSALGAIPPSVVDGTARVTEMLRPNWQVRTPSTKVAKLARVLAASGPEDAYRALTTHWDGARSMVLDAPSVAEGGGVDMRIEGASITEQMLWWDLVGYLPDDILVKLDRAAMSVSLETRAPFLDREVLELAWRLPLSAKLRGGQTKWALRQVLERHVPAGLVDRPKMGFGLPIGTWLRTELAPWAEHLLDERRLRIQGLLDPAPIRTAWQLHCSGRRDLGYELWDILVLQAWIDHWQPNL